MDEQEKQVLPTSPLTYMLRMLVSVVLRVRTSCPAEQAFYIRSRRGEAKPRRYSGSIDPCPTLKFFASVPTPHLIFYHLL